MKAYFIKLKSETKAAFTLIELLVVISIISLLVSILLPSLNNARELAKAAVCSSNVRSIGLAMIFYSTDEADYFPMQYNSTYSDFWFNALKTTLPDGSITHDNNMYNAAFMCPSEENHHQTLIDYASNGPYITNTPGVGHDPIKPQNISNPAGMVMVCDGRQPMSSGYCGSWFVFAEYGHGMSFFANPDVYAGPYPPRHGDCMNFVFADGHVEKIVVDPDNVDAFDRLARMFAGI